MKRAIYLCITAFISINFCFAQDMQKGFTMLETGKYKNAETFFSNTLKEYPKNRTAKLCYGRAVGLNGDATKAKGVFTKLLELYPDSFEIKLNFAESLLWNKEFKKAKIYYHKLITEDATSFPALLGYANTLSNLKEYTDALSFINKALDASKNNPNALVSKKYIYLGLANQQLQNQDYENAISTLKSNFTLFPKDKDIYLNLANTYVIAKQYSNATATYTEMVANKELYFISKNGLALVAHLQEKDKEALAMSSKTLSVLNKNTTKKDRQNTQERYAQALIWNKKFNAAKTYINTIAVNHENENWILALKATLYTYTGNFNKSIKAYDNILKNDIKSFDGNLGKANALKANNKTKQAYKTAEKALSFFPKQKDIINFMGQIKQSLIPNLISKVAYSFDNGESKAYTFNSNINIPVNTKAIFKATYNYKNAFNKLTDNNSVSNLFGLGASYQIHSKINVSAIAGINKVKGNKNEYKQFTTDILIKTKPYKLQNLDIGYKRELQNFNAELLNRDIIQNHFYANYNVNTNFKLGWFTQYFHTTQSDANSRNLLFTSLYYNLLSKPILKTGISYQYLAFKNQVPTIYFSPSSFNAVEIFINLIKDKTIVKNKEIYYGLTAAIGYQFIEQQSKQSTYRVQANLGYKFNERCFLESYVTHSNIASAAASGFTFTEVGLKFKWLFLKKPIFKI